MILVSDRELYAKIYMQVQVGMSEYASGPVNEVGLDGGITSSDYHCYNCDRTVTIIATNQVICPSCNGVVLEEVMETLPPPSSPPGSDHSFDYFFPPLYTAPGSDSESDLELSHLLPPPPPPPFFTTSTDFCYPLPGSPPPVSNRNTRAIISGIEIDLSEILLPDRDHHFTRPPPCPPPPPPPQHPFFTTNSDLSYSIREFNSSDPLPPPPPPLPRVTTNRSTVAIISGLEIDFSESPDTDQDFPHPPPPPPPPPPPIDPIRRVHRLPPLSLSATPNRSSHNISPPLPPAPASSSSMSWDYFFPVLEEEEDEHKDEMMLLDKKNTTEEMWGSKSEAGSQCAVCIEDIEVNQSVRQMPCKHMYHSHCILRWLESHNTCPVCRYRLN